MSSGLQVTSRSGWGSTSPPPSMSILVEVVGLSLKGKPTQPQQVIAPELHFLQGLIDGLSFLPLLQLRLTDRCKSRPDELHLPQDYNKLAKDRLAASFSLRACEPPRLLLERECPRPCLCDLFFLRKRLGSSASRRRCR